MSYRKHLTASGIPESRHWDLNSTMQTLHSALCKLDERNLALLEEIHPGISDIADAYAKHEDAGLRRFPEIK